MAWILDNKVWKCSQYSDLDRNAINNLAEYGEPFSPDQPDYVKNFVPDFGNVIVEMPQSEVMTNGYGKSVLITDFPLIRRFLDGSLRIPDGSRQLGDLIKSGFVREQDRIISTNLYGKGGDSAYIHGTVAFALMRRSVFTVAPAFREVRAEIGALDDNWDFHSSTIPDAVNSMVAATLGPKHNNLTAPIQLLYRGPGVSKTVQRPIPSKSRSRFPKP